MIYQAGYVYHIKDEYFEKANDRMLMQNKENGTYQRGLMQYAKEKGVKVIELTEKEKAAFIKE